jgi:hypothetical protein
MTNLDKYDSTTERVEDATVEERLIKFSKIADLLQKENILIVDIEPHCVVLEDKTCGYKLHHNVITWDIYRVIDVADMIINGRNEYLKRKLDNEALS